MIYPWQQALWTRLTRADHALPHALLLRGPQGVGKFQFALALAQTLLCETVGAERRACGRCVACGWFAQGHHPDFLRVEPESEQAVQAEAAEGESKKKPTPNITVPAVRQIVEFLALTTHRSGYRIVLLHPAESMNAHAANALLKTLEEPPPRSLFILVCHNSDPLPATVLSRCRQVAMPVPDKQLAIAWLEEQGIAQAELMLALAGGSPLRALAKLEQERFRAEAVRRLLAPEAHNPIAYAEFANSASLEANIELLQTWCYDLMAVKSGAQQRYHLDCGAALGALQTRVRGHALLQFDRLLGEAKRLQHHPLNARLVLENLFLAYGASFSATGDVGAA